MGIFKSIKVKKALKEIEKDVDAELIKRGLLKIENGNKNYALGCCNVQWKIQKQLLKERYNIDWKTPQEEHPDWNFD